MAAKVMVKELQLMASDPKSTVLMLILPFLFRFLLPGFNGPAFPAMLIAYLILGVVSTRADGMGIKTGPSQFPVRMRDHVLGVFLSQAAVVLLAVFLGWLYMLVSGPEQFMAGIVPKTLGLGLLLTGLMTALGLWLRPQVSRAVNMIAIILFLNLVIFQPASGAVFLPQVSVPLALGGGALGFSLLLALGLLYPPRL